MIIDILHIIQIWFSCLQILFCFYIIYCPVRNKDLTTFIKIISRLNDNIISERGEEEELAPALGYTAHLVSIISYIFGIPLRFPVTPALSLSTIRDDITAKLDEKRV